MTRSEKYFGDLVRERHEIPQPEPQEEWINEVLWDAAFASCKRAAEMVVPCTEADDYALYPEDDYFDLEEEIEKALSEVNND